MTEAAESFGEYGGQYVPETLIPALDELTAAWSEARADPRYLAELDELGRTYVGRPSPLTRAERFAPGKRLYLKREDLMHTGAHKLNNALGQVVLAGGLGPANVAEAIAAVGPWAVDASSSLEISPGVKDHGRVRAYVEAARG